MRTTDEPCRTSWSRPVNLTAALAGEPPPAPSVGYWSGETGVRALFYPNEVHSVFGDPEALKSWLLLLASVQEVKLGRHVFYLDMEANDRSIVDRLRLLGASSTRIRKNFHYFRPDDRISDADQVRFRSLVNRYKPTLVVLDGVTEAFAVHGLSINSPEDTAHWFRNFARQFQVKATPDYAGPAIVELDHVVKDRDARNGWAIGSVHKKAGIKGAAYQVVSASPFGKSKHGVSRLFLEKDSPGGVEWIAHGKHRQRLVAELHCDATGGGVDAWIESPAPVAETTAEQELPPAQTLKFRTRMLAIWAFVNDNPGASGRTIRANVSGGDKEKRDATEQLVDEGYIENKGTRTGAQYVALKDFEPLRVTPKGGASRAK